MAEEKTERKSTFKPRPGDGHVIERQGKAFITHTGLQAKLLDQGKFVKAKTLEILQWPWENELRLFVCKSRMTVVNEKGVEAVYEAIGDASPHDSKSQEHVKAHPMGVDNVGAMVRPHFFRMGETRADVRCLRQATRSEYTAFEEIS